MFFDAISLDVLLKLFIKCDLNHLTLSPALLKFSQLYDLYSLHLLNFLVTELYKLVTLLDLSACIYNINVFIKDKALKMKTFLKISTSC